MGVRTPGLWSSPGAGGGSSALLLLQGLPQLPGDSMRAGMIAPGSCCALVITGRKEGSKGAYFGWMAEKRLEMGAQEALNLDGGGTSALVFMAMFSTVRKTACPCAKERAE